MVIRTRVIREYAKGIDTEADRSAFLALLRDELAARWTHAESTVVDLGGAYWTASVPSNEGGHFVMHVVDAAVDEARCRLDLGESA